MPEAHGHLGPYVDGNGNLYTVVEDLPADVRDGARLVFVTHSIPLAMNEASGRGEARGGKGEHRRPAAAEHEGDHDEREGEHAERLAPVALVRRDRRLPLERVAVGRGGEQRGRSVVLLFYPGDETPVCTRQFCSYRDRSDELQALGCAAAISACAASRSSIFF